MSINEKDILQKTTNTDITDIGTEIGNKAVQETVGTAASVASTAAVTGLATKDPSAVGSVAATTAAGAGVNMAMGITSTAIDNAISKLPPAAQKAIKALVDIGLSVVQAIIAAKLTEAIKKNLADKAAKAAFANHVRDITKNPENNPPTEQKKPETQEKPIEGTETSATGEEIPAAVVKADIIITDRLGVRYLVKDVLCVNIRNSYGDITEAHFSINSDGLVINIKTNEKYTMKDWNSYGQPVEIHIHDKNITKQEEDPNTNSYLLYITSTNVDHHNTSINHGDDIVDNPIMITARSVFEFLNSQPYSWNFAKQTIEYIVKTTLNPHLSRFPNIKLLIEGVRADIIEEEHPRDLTPYQFIHSLANKYGYVFYTIEEYIIFGSPHYIQSRYLPNAKPKKTLKYHIDYTHLNICTQIHPIENTFTEHHTATSDNIQAKSSIDPNQEHSLLSDALKASQQLYSPGHFHNVGGHGISPDQLKQLQETLQRQNASAMVRVTLSTSYYGIDLYDEIAVEYFGPNKETYILALHCIAINSYVDGRGLFHNHIECMLAH